MASGVMNAITSIVQRNNDRLLHLCQNFERRNCHKPLGLHILQQVSSYEDDIC